MSNEFSCPFPLCQCLWLWFIIVITTTGIQEWMSKLVSEEVNKWNTGIGMGNNSNSKRCQSTQFSLCSHSAWTIRGAERQAKSPSSPKFYTLLMNLPRPLFLKKYWSNHKKKRFFPHVQCTTEHDVHCMSIMHRNSCMRSQTLDGRHGWILFESERKRLVWRHHSWFCETFADWAREK